MACRALAPERTHASSSLQPLLQLGVLAALHREALGLLLQVGRVVALVGVGAAAVEFEDPLGDVVQEVPVVGDGQDRALVLGEVLFEPLHALGVEVVGRLVEQQQVGLGQQQLAQRDAAALTAGQVGDRLVGRRAAQRVHRLLELGVDVPRVGGVQLLLQLAHLLHQLVGVVGGHQLGDLVVPVELGLDVATPSSTFSRTVFVLVERRLLLQDADRGAGLPGTRRRCWAVSRPAMIRKTLDLPAPFGPTTPIFAPGRKFRRDVVKDDLVAVRLADLPHRVDEFGHAVVLPF